ncbi:hypothetical protein E9549_07685 [Blastococcus sp. MG754426]|uniref:hypothetical protein n=1 Tax=unclassified Blastococcus TaxID=2619396 RepID=UPI001EF0CC1B|nr:MULTISPECIES: hypothetical protein [unclassified Blastococcus]MCF6507288.1 hypothetical protein [Blastococcus sp. MG754426]MCF6510774.1 hypothetical protein [Blastococcus sp. MG754427]
MLPGRPPDPRRTARALQDAAVAALLAPSANGARPWLVRVRPGSLELRADRSRRSSVPDRRAREPLQGAGAALLDARVSLAAAGLAVEVRRLPLATDPQLLAEVCPVAGSPDPALAALGPGTAPVPAAGEPLPGPLEPTPARLPPELVRALVEAASAEDVTLVPVDREDRLRLLADLVRLAEPGPRAGPADRAEPVDVRPGAGQTVVLLATARDDELAWLRSGEARRRVLRIAGARGWTGDPLHQVVEVPVVRMQVRSALSWHAHPQDLLRLGRVTAPPAGTAARGRATPSTG